jgi:CheY-like chemotaxis protein
VLDLRTRIMVAAGDDRENARVRGLFNNIGYLDTDSANSAAVAIQRLHTTDMFSAAAFGLIYIDWVLQGPKAGQELVSLIRSDYKIKLMAIVFAVETHRVPFARTLAKEQLVDGWVLKPPSQDALLAALTPIEPRLIPPFNV